MYFAKTRKQMEGQDTRELQERCQRTDAGRTLLQQVRVTEDTISRRCSKDGYQSEELPDGAFVSPKNTPAHVSVIKPDTVKSVIVCHTPVSRSAEYIGSFSVSGSNENSRAQQLETQLQSLQSVKQGKLVELQISVDGIRVFHSDDQTILMCHEMKRVSYATCDPLHRQFSFLSREKHMNLQYCHTFKTVTPEQAEELNLIVGDAFKMAYAKLLDKQPTFHELIEAQIFEQQAKFRNIEKQAHVELRRKLAEIARPTPFSHQAIQRMEQRKFALDEVESELLVGKNKLWAKHAVDQTQHRISLHEGFVDETPASTLGGAGRSSDPSVPAMVLHRREAIGRETIMPEPVAAGTSNVLAHAMKNVSKHNASPLFAADQLRGQNQVPSQVARVAKEAKRDPKVKGSPVTALKTEVDRRIAPELEPALIVEMNREGTPQPSSSGLGNKGLAGGQRSGTHHSRSSLEDDDHHLSSSSSSSIASLTAVKQADTGPRTSPLRKHPPPLPNSDDEEDESSGMLGKTGYENISMYVKASACTPAGSHIPVVHRNLLTPSHLPPDGVTPQSPAPPPAEGEIRLEAPPSPEERPPRRRVRFETSPSDESSSAGYTEWPAVDEDSLPDRDDISLLLEELGLGTTGMMSQSWVFETRSLDRREIGDPSLRQAAWYQAGIPREVALEILQHEDMGSFIVRDSTTHPGCYALSVLLPGPEGNATVSHYVIMKTPRGVRLKGCDREWPSLAELVTHHTKVAEVIPLQLQLPRRNTRNLMFLEEEKEDPDDEIPYVTPIDDISGLVGQLRP